MVEPLQERAALPATAPAATGKARARLHERSGLCLVQVVARAGHGRDCARILGLELPERASTALRLDAVSVLCLRPRDWLIVTENRAGRAGGIALAARERLAGHAAAIDQSHGRVVLRLAGEGAGELLQQGLNLDLHPTAFPEDAMAQTGLNGIALLVHCLAAQRFDLYVARSFAASLADWLVHHGANLESEPAK